MVAALLAYWRKAPPVHEIVAAFVGYKPPPEIAKAEEQDAANEAALADLFAQFPDGRVR